MSDENTKLSATAMSDKLTDLIYVEKDARDFGFNWSNIDMILDQVISECKEVKDAISNQESNERVQEEVGDLLHTAISLCIFAGFDIEQILEKATRKFNSRMVALKDLTKQQGLTDLQGQPMDYMLDLWAKAKTLSK